ncbi:hypothetical protein SAMN05445504_2371 [Burkholderia sp. CF099]|nr:hypothetical protein SAMN05445504_2371 [Burkholderia sp. CF099]
MARKTAFFSASAGRDKGKVFLVTELPASRAEEWATRALFIMVNCGVDIPDELLSSGLAGLAAVGLKALTRVPFDLAKPLFDEMMTCVEALPDPRNRDVVRPLIEDDIEEVATRVQLRKTILDLHMDFFRDAAPSQQAQDAANTSLA